MELDVHDLAAVHVFAPAPDGHPVPFAVAAQDLVQGPVKPVVAGGRVGRQGNLKCRAELRVALCHGQARTRPRRGSASREGMSTQSEPFRLTGLCAAGSL